MFTVVKRKTTIIIISPEKKLLSNNSVVLLPRHSPGAGEGQPLPNGTKRTPVTLSYRDYLAENLAL